VTDHIIKAIAQACGVQKNLIIENTLLKVKTVEAEKSWVQLVDSKIDFVSSSNRVPELIFPGSFNPFHSGHNSMSELAEKKTWIRPCL
jgi:nicotinamide mononucleotide adenylyltransferase